MIDFVGAQIVKPTDTLSVDFTICVLALIGMLLTGCAADDPPQLAFDMIELTGLVGERVAINPAEVVSIREPREKGRAVHPHANCIISTTDGKFISVIEECTEVERRLEHAH